MPLITCVPLIILSSVVEDKPLSGREILYERMASIILLRSNFPCLVAHQSDELCDNMY